MPTVVQFRRGTTVQNNNFLGANGEISVDTDLHVLRIADGATLGGFALVGQNCVQTIANKTYTGASLSVTGNVSGNYILGNGSQLTGIDATSIQNGTSNVRVVSSGGNVTVGVANTSNVVVVSTTGANITGTLNASGNANVGNIGAVNAVFSGALNAIGNITGSYILGNGSQLTGIDATSIQNGTSNVRVVSSGGNVTTSVGGTANVLVVTGTGANIAGTLGVTGNITAGNLSGTSIVGTLTTASQTNITSVGTLGSLTVSGNITPGGIAMSTGNATIGNLYVSGTTTIAGNIVQVSGNSGQFFGNSSTGFNALYAGLPAGFTLLPQSVVNFVSQFDDYSQINNQNQSAGNTATSDWVLTSNNGNDSTYYADFGIASSTYDGAVAVLNNAMGNSVTPNDAYLYTTGNVAAGNPSDLVLGAIDVGGQIRFPVGGSTMANVAMKLNAPNTTSSSTTTGTAVITGGVGVSGNITSGNLSVGTGTITVNNIVNSGSNATGNIGSSSTYFNTVFAKATSAQYADVAEKYVADKIYPPGTVVEFGGQAEVTITTVSSSPAVAGIISTNPAFIMNAGENNINAVAVALLGRVPCRVVGDIKKGDRLVSSDIPGVAKKLNPAEYQPGCILGKALENYSSSEPGVIEVIGGRL